MIGLANIFSSISLANIFSSSSESFNRASPPALILPFRNGLFMHLLLIQLSLVFGFSFCFPACTVRQMPDHGLSWFSHNPEWCAVEAFSFMDRATARNVPYFLYFAFTLPHMPSSGVALTRSVTHVPDRRFAHGDGHATDPAMRQKLQAMEAMRARSKKHVTAGRVVASHNSHGMDWTGSNDKNHNVPGLLWIDSIIGEFYDRLQSLGQLQDSLLIFTADHGCVAKGHCFEPVRARSSRNGARVVRRSS